MFVIDQIAKDVYQIGIREGEAGPFGYVAFLLTGEPLTLIEPGSTRAARQFLGAIRHVGHDPRRVRYLVPTHIHVDHGGAAGFLLEHMPEAKVVFHERAARHAIDPSRLIAGTAQAFGPRWEEMHGPILPVPEGRLVVVKDGDTMTFGGREHRFVYTPGHAPHHVSIFDPGLGLLYCGEALGYLRGAKVIAPPSSPPSYDPVAAMDSIRRLSLLKPRTLVYSHAGHSDRRPEEAIKLVTEITQEFGRMVEEALQDGSDAPELERRLRVLLYGSPTGDSGETDMAIRGYLAYFEQRKGAMPQ